MEKKRWGIFQGFKGITKSEFVKILLHIELAGSGHVFLQQKQHTGSLWGWADSFQLMFNQENTHLLFSSHAILCTTVYMSWNQVQAFSFNRGYLHPDQVNGEKYHTHKSFLMLGFNAQWLPEAWNPLTPPDTGFIHIHHCHVSAMRNALCCGARFRVASARWSPGAARARHPEVRAVTQHDTPTSW